jgi:protein-L-isoaspartate(D-aspartate) O-methyltransferase
MNGERQAPDSRIQYFLDDGKAGSSGWKDDGARYRNPWSANGRGCVIRLNILRDRIEAESPDFYLTRSPPGMDAEDVRTFKATMKARSNDDLIDDLSRYAAGSLNGQALGSRVLGAMRSIDRSLFLPACSREEAYRDAPLPIGHGQTCSQPSLVAFMLDRLDIRRGNRLLEIGSGCGYSAAIAARLCGTGGRVFAAELVPELAEWSRACYGHCHPDGPVAPPVAATITFLIGDGSAGYPEHGPYDRILVSAGVRRSSFGESLLLDQLAPDGALIYPEERGLVFLIRKSDAGWHREQWGHVAFVPLRGRNS